MSLQAVELQDYIDRIAEILEADTTLFPPETTGENLVTAIVRNKPAIEQSAEGALVPYILVFESDQPIQFYEKAGRDGRNTEGGSVYELEIYCVVITNADLIASSAQLTIHKITQVVRNALSRNLRLADPADLTLDPLCRTHSRFEIAYALRGDVPATMYARNVVVRPQVYVSPRG